MLRLCILLGLLGGLLIAGTAQAVMVDLTDGSWSHHGGASASRTFGDNTVTLSTGGSGPLRFSQAYDGGGTCSLLACKSDGVGIGDDEISYGGERLTATFSSAVTLNRVHFLDLFAGEGEYAMMRINFAGEPLIFSATASADGGYLLSDEFSYSNVLSIEFFTDDDSGKSDFALAGLEFEWVEDITSEKISSEEVKQDGARVKAAAIVGPLQQIAQSVPAPGLLWLMLIGLLMMGLTGTRSRRLPESLSVLLIRP